MFAKKILNPKTSIFPLSRSFTTLFPQKKAVFFDANGVIYWRKRNKYQALSEVVGDVSIADKTKLPPRLKELNILSSEGAIQKKDYFEEILDYFKVEQSLREKALHEMYEAESSVTIFEGVPETLKELRSRHIKLGIITDSTSSSEEKHDWLKKQGFSFHFDAFINSSEVGVKKPHPDIYNKAIDLIGLPPNFSAFVGHNRSELEGAKNVGLTTIVFNPDDETCVGDFAIQMFKDLLTLPILEGIFVFYRILVQVF
eukprot:TRINITY_DN6903_c0_g1_i1.p1 TRINITY_DN6903_c0_g1~~TRINITY_DN6903_c0_g1_i1.p1  ORF type:complete len:275 (-),score=66.83 TRINITY_DN6903_c0_g1_i1:48-815(-)